MLKYFAKPTLAFLFLWFSNNNDGMNFAKEKFRKLSKDGKYMHAMVAGTKAFAQEAHRFLRKNKSPLSAKLINYTYERGLINE